MLWRPLNHGRNDARTARTCCAWEISRMESCAFRDLSAHDHLSDFAGPVAMAAAACSSASGNALPTDERARTSKLVRAVQRTRRRREECFDSALFADPAWDMLLELYGSYLEQRRIAVSSLCVAAHVPATTALRWIAKLEQDGLAERKDDPNDARRSWIELTADGVDRMTRYFDVSPAALLSI